MLQSWHFYIGKWSSGRSFPLNSLQHISLTDFKWTNVSDPHFYCIFGGRWQLREEDLSSSYSSSSS